MDNNRRRPQQQKSKILRKLQENSQNAKRHTAIGDPQGETTRPPQQIQDRPIQTYYIIISMPRGGPYSFPYQFPRPLRVFPIDVSRAVLAQRHEVRTICCLQIRNPVFFGMDGHPVTEPEYNCVQGRQAEPRNTAAAQRYRHLDPVQRFRPGQVPSREPVPGVVESPQKKVFKGREGWPSIIICSQMSFG